jgi:hypothetical protein
VHELSGWLSRGDPIGTSLQLLGSASMAGLQKQRNPGKGQP